MKEKIEQALEEIRPKLALHAGGIEFVHLEDGVVKVRLLGTCHGCPLSQLTLKAGVEELLKERVPGVERVEAVS
jgi:Fe-S cluster biogenesis protein NfuA